LGNKENRSQYRKTAQAAETVQAVGTVNNVCGLTEKGLPV
jgi:hypothetical protein